MSFDGDPAIDGLAVSAADALAQMLSAIERGHMPTCDQVIGDSDFQHGMHVLKSLFARDQLVVAAPLALLLAVCRPARADCTYLAGRIFQKLKSWQVAAWLFALCAPVGEAAVVLYRLGQCLQALGQAAVATQLFERAYDIARGDDGSRRLQGLIERRLLGLG